MPVRNISSIGNTKPIPVHVFIPPLYNAIYKLEIVSDSGTYDITDIVIEGEYTNGVTETVGSFSITFDNSKGNYTNTFSIYDKLNIYIDYGASATTKRFVGLIERISKTGSKIIISGKGTALRTLMKNVTYSATEKERSEVLKAIIDKYFSGIITTNNISSDTTKITVSYEEKPFWEIVEELSNAAGYDSYVDVDFDFHYFESGSITNETECIVHENNLVETGDFTPDLELVSNRVRVYGKKTEGIPLLATAEDTSAQSDIDGDIREYIITDESIDTKTEAQNRADFELANRKDPPIIGNVISLGLPTLQPGEKLRISDPLNGLDPKAYMIRKYRHIFSNDDPLKTEVTIQKTGDSLVKVLKGRIKFETEIRNPINPNEMESSVVYDFSSDVGTHSGTEIDTEAQVLKTTGGSTGTWISPVTTVSSNVTGVEVRIKGNKVDTTNAYISVDGGTTYTPTNFSGTQKTLSGKDLRVKVSINSADTEVKGVGILYKT